MQDKLKVFWQNVLFHVSPLLKLFKVCFRIARLLTLAILGAMLIFVFIIENSSMQMQSEIHNNYKKTNISNIYVSEEIANFDTSKITDVLDGLPKPVHDAIYDDWIIVISNETPLEAFATHGSTMGITYYEYNIIWMHSDFTANHFAHECGHVFDFITGELHRTKEFESLYWNNWDKYIKHDETNPDSHSVSSAGEYWADMYSEYYCYPEYFKEHFSEAYEYFNRVSEETWRFTTLGRYHGICNRMFDIVGEKILNFFKRPVTTFKLTWNSVSNVFNKKIDLNDYEYYHDYQFKFEETEVVYNKVIDIINHPDNYKNTIELRFPVDMDFEAYLEAQSFLQIYFMNDSANIVGIGATYDGQVYTTLLLNKNELLNLENERLKSLSLVESTLSDMKDGTETDKLMFISSFMIDYCEYGHILESSTSNRFWDNQIGNSLTHAMVFKQFAERLNIQCDIVMSPFDTGINHYFNKVTLSDGTIRYYDITRASENLINVEEYDRIIFSTNIIEK